VVKDLYENVKDILQNMLNEGSEMKAFFQGYYKLRRPSKMLDDVGTEICRLSKLAIELFDL